VFERCRRESIISASALSQLHGLLEAWMAGDGVLDVNGGLARRFRLCLGSGWRLNWGSEWVRVALQRSALDRSAS
jgi:hypothetical protein